MPESLPDALPILGSSAWRYRLERHWARLPRGWNFDTDESIGPPRAALKGGVAANGDVYVLSRSAHPVCLFDASGRFITSWGEAAFSVFVHGLSIAPDQTVWITDSGTHAITVHEPSGKPIRTLGTPGVPSPPLYAKPLNMPSDLAFGRDAIYVGGRDGLSIWTRNREPIIRWGADEPAPGTFNIHGIWLDAEENIYLAHFDRAVSKLTRLS